MKLITIALPKGKLEELTLKLLSKIGLTFPQKRGRELIFFDTENRFKVMTIRATDVPVYVEHGAADIGVVGLDILAEQEADVYQPLDLGFGYCRMVVARPQAKPTLSGDSLIRVATKFPRLTERHFSNSGRPAEIIKLYGSIELAPLVGLSDVIVDLVSSGRTLKDNGLEEVETILTSSARLIVNRASLKTKYSEIKPLLEKLKEIVKQGELSHA